MSETTNLKLFKHNNPSTNTNPFDVEQALNENWDKIDTAVGDLQNNNDSNKKDIADLKKRVTEIENDLETVQTDITNIKEEQTTQNNNIETNGAAIETNAKNIEKNATDIQALQEENANLKAQIPTGKASGEEISLRDSAEMELVEFGLQGNSKQETREGYNLIDVTTLSDEVKSKDISYDEGFYVKDNSPDSDNRAWSYSQCNWKDILLKAGTYTIALLFSTQIKNTRADKYLQVFDNNSNSIAVAEKGLITNKDVFVQEFTLSQDTTIGIEIKAYDGIYRIMLLKGTYTTENLPNFEEYGAMPSLDYPSEVEAVGDNINLFDGEKLENKGYSQTTGELQDDNTTYCNKNIIPISQGKVIVQENGKSVTTRLFFYDNEKNYISNAKNDNEIVEIPSNARYMNFQVGKALVTDWNKFKIEIGETITPYSSYGQGSVEIVKSNKNLINNLPSTTTINGITFTNNGDGTITINGTATSVAYIVLKTLTLEDIDYSISGCPQGGSNETYSQYIFIPSTGGGLANDFGKGATFRNSNKPTVEVRLRIASGYKANNLIFRPQLEKGAATNFVENESKTYIISVQKPFYKIGDYKDSFIRQNNKRYEQHNIKELIFTGNENWSKSTTINAINRFTLIITDLLNGMPETADTFSNSFKAIKYSDAQSQLGITHNSQLLIINHSFSENETITLEQFKTKLQNLYNAGTPVKMYYILSTPELIECTEEQTQVLEQIIEDGTYKSVTHYYTTQELKATIEVKYYKDLETIINKQEQMQATLNNVQAQILELGGN